MSTDSSLPAFKLSGNGLASDFRTLKEQEIIAMGWWKGQFMKYYAAVAGYTYINGIKCYGSNVPIGTYSTKEITYYAATNLSPEITQSTIYNNLKVISDGSFYFKVNGLGYTITGLDFTSSSSLYNALEVINAELSTSTFSVYTTYTDEYVYDNDGKIETDEFGDYLTVSTPHYFIKVATTSKGDDSTITELKATDTGTFIGDALQINETITQGYVVGDTTDVTNMIGFMETIGYDDDSIDDLAEDFSESGADEINLIWNREYDFEEDDFTEIVSDLRSEFYNVAKVEVHNSCISEGNGGLFEEPITTGQSVALNYPELATSLFYEKRGFGWEPAFGLQYPSELGVYEQTIRCYDSDGNNITSSINSDALIALKSILWISGDKAMTYEGSVITGRTEWSYFDSDNGSSTYTRIHSKETYTGAIKDTFDDEYENYSMDYHWYGYTTDDWGVESVDDAGDDRHGRNYAAVYLNLIWMYREAQMTYSSGNDSGIFVLNSGYRSSNDGYNYMSVEGVKNASPAELQEAIAKHAGYDVKYSSSGHSFLGGLWSGITSFLSTAINIIASIVIKIPVLRLQVQINYWMFNGGDWTNDDDELRAAASIHIIVIIGVALAISGIDETSKIANALYAAMAAYDVYSGVQDLKSLRESKEYADAMAKLSDAEALLVEEAMDTSELLEVDSINQMEEQFMPLEDDMYTANYDLFGADSEFTINEFK